MYVTHQKLYGCSIRDRGVINKQAISNMKIRSMANKNGLRSMLRLIFNFQTGSQPEVHRTLNSVLFLKLKMKSSKIGKQVEFEDEVLDHNGNRRPRNSEGRSLKSYQPYISHFMSHILLNSYLLLLGGCRTCKVWTMDHSLWTIIYGGVPYTSLG